MLLIFKFIGINLLLYLQLVIHRVYFVSLPLESIEKQDIKGQDNNAYD